MDNMGSHLTLWINIHNALGDLTERMWDRSTALVGLSTDPRLVSTQLFKRIYGHARAFSLLWSNRLNLDADVVLRSAIEVAICLANLELRREQFVADLRSDAAHTSRAQIPLWFQNDPNAVNRATREMEDVFGARRPTGGKHKRLEWEALATGGGVEALYEFYKHLSGTRVHVTGLSMIGDVVRVEEHGSEERARTLKHLQRTMALKMMCGALQISCNRHAILAGFADEAKETVAIADSMKRLSLEEAAA